MMKNAKLQELRKKYPNVSLNTQTKDDLTEYKCSCCNKKYRQKFDEKLKKRFLNTYKLSNHGNNNFISFLLKNVFRYKYMDDWKKSHETSLHEKEGFSSHLTVKDITDADCAHAKSVCIDFKIKILGEYHNLYYHNLYLYYHNLLTDINMLLMVEIGTREETCHSIYKHSKTNNK